MPWGEIPALQTVLSLICAVVLFYFLQLLAGCQQVLLFSCGVRFGPRCLCLSLGDQLSCVHGHERHVSPHGVPVQAQLGWSHHLCGSKVHQRHWLPAPGLWPLGMWRMGQANAENPICKRGVFVADNSYIVDEMLFVFLCCPCLCVGYLFIPLALIKNSNSRVL